MQGNILTYSEESDEGIITGPGGSRYKFGKADWKENCPVISRVNVDFIVEGDRATEIYCTDTETLKKAIYKSEADKMAELERLEKQKQEIEKSALKNEFSGFYISADKKLWKGVLAGLAHKFGHKVFWYRIAPPFTMFWAMIREGKDNISGGVTAAIAIGIAFTAFYFYAARKWTAKYTNSNAAATYTSKIVKDNNEKLAASLNKTANIMGTLAGRGSNSIQPESTGSINKTNKFEPAQNERQASVNNKESPGSQAAYNQDESSAFPARTPVAVRGAVILGRDKYQSNKFFNFCHKCEACGHATTNIIQSDRCDSERTYTGKFYCIKCSNLQDVEIRVV